jgi:hypothetical protein
MNNARLLPGLFFLAALYEGLLGLVLVLAPWAPFGWFGVDPPYHPGYVQFPGALLVVFAIMFANIARAPVKNGVMIPYGMMLKVAYCAVILYHWFTTGLPTVFMTFCILDLLFLAAFVWAWAEFRRGET